MPPRIPSFAYETILRPLLFRLDPETAHHWAIALLSKTGPFFPGPGETDPRLERRVFGLSFANPVGLAAGFDKNAVALPAWEGMGFGFVEAGTITAEPQPGNPRPRIFRLAEQGGIINRLGFNNDGAEAVAHRLARLRAAGKWPSIPVGLNIGKSKATPLEQATSDYLSSFEALFSFADYFVLNVSSPNTPGLRGLQDKSALGDLLRAIQARNRALAESTREKTKPILVKIAPDLSWPAIGDILELVSSGGGAGIVATNTTVDHSGIPAAKRETGGLSGRPLRARATEVVRFIASQTSLPIIAVGGIFDAESAREKFDAGAQLVQLYTGFIFRGPSLICEICASLARTS